MITRKQRHTLAAELLMKYSGTSKAGASLRLPLPTVLTGGGKGGGHLAEVRAFLVKYYGAPSGQSQSLFDPLHTIPTKDRFGLVTVNGVHYQIVDIGMRMLEPHELFPGQGFPDDYNHRPLFNGKPLTKTAQTDLCGNAVCPPNAAALAGEAVGVPWRMAA